MRDGFARLGGGVAIAGAGRDVAVKNRTGHDLRAVILKLPDEDPVYFARIGDGEQASWRAGRRLDRTADEVEFSTSILTASHRSGSVTLNPLNAYLLRPLTEGDAPGLSSAWGAVEQSATDGVDWFPDDVPVLLAQMDGGEGPSTDSGLRLESDRVLVRVVGYGGAP